MTFVCTGELRMLDKLTRWMQKNGESTLLEGITLDPDNIPQHVAIIMDGNGRWARQRALPRIMGHRAGMKTVKEITKAADEIGVKVLTLYAFSTENWKRPTDEVEFLMKLPQEFLTIELGELIERNVQVRMMGDHTKLPAHTLQAIREAQEKTKTNTGLILNFALNYGSRAEILDAVRHIAAGVQNGTLSEADITEDVFSSYLETSGLPDPDMLIRTSGELRLSNFLLWQLAYSEFIFHDGFWPDFSPQDFYNAIQEYQRRSRRYGAL